jgi:hypothetical protein
MNRIIYVPSAVMSLAFIVVYACRCKRTRSPMSITAVVSCVLNAGGVMSGLILIAGTFHEDLYRSLAGLNLYMLIAGLVVLLVSLRAVVRVITLAGPSDLPCSGGKNRRRLGSRSRKIQGKGLTAN